MPKKTSSQLLSAIFACFQPIYKQDSFSCTPVDAFTLQFYCQKWGDIGTINLIETSPGKSEPRFYPPRPISSDELAKYENLISEECIGPSGRLAELFGQKDVVRALRSQALYEKRLQRLQEFKVWLSHCLQIFGYHNLPFNPVLDGSAIVDEHFDFIINGTPAQFGVMLRQFAQNLHNKSTYKKLVCQVLLPGGRKDAGNIPPDANPIDIKFSVGKNLLSIHAHVLPTDGTLLRIHLNGERILWDLWDAIRDELEKLGWFSLPEIPEVTASTAPQVVTIIGEQSQPSSPTAEIWMTIPDVGPNREILRHWHKGLTCEQIAVRVSLSAKTVLNRINKLRKEHGAEIVPYRKSNYIPNSRKKSS